MVFAIHWYESAMDLHMFPILNPPSILKNASQFMALRCLKFSTDCPVHIKKSLSSVQFSCIVKSDSLRPHGLQHARLPCPSSALRVCSNSCPSSKWIHSTISSSVVPFSSTFNLSQHQGLFPWVSSLWHVAKVLEFQLQHQSFQWTPRTDLL